MEVHHHAHTARKRFTHYVWEFLMLFLAVFCGFLAENFREHQVEHSRAREYAISMVKDLKSDTAAITGYQKTVLTYIGNTDSLMELSRQPLEGSNATKFSFFTRFAYWTASVNWNRITFEQVKNSGSLRYFNHELVEKLLNYDAKVSDIKYEAYNNEVRGNQLINLINRILDPAYHQEVSKLAIYNLDTLSSAYRERLLSIPASNLENKRTEIREYLNMLVVQQRNFRITLRRLHQADSMAMALIPLFKKVYDIKD